MALIGKSVRVLGGLNFDFTLTISGTAYHFDKKSASSSVSGRYTFVRDKIGWYLIVYASGTINFAKLNHALDYTGIGGGGGGGGGVGYGTDYWGGHGGAGAIATQSAKSVNLNVTYTITLGSGGSAGGGAGAHSTASQGGGAGTATTFNAPVALSAAGGSGGGGAYNGNGTAGNTNAKQYIFNDSSRIATYWGGYNQGLRGSGGDYGGPGPGGADWGYPGDPGFTGAFAIRSTPKA